MSIQELETALMAVPLEEVRRFRRMLDARLSEEAGGDGAAEPPTVREAEEGDDVDERRRELAEIINWTGGEGLDYQRRVRSEWDDRSSTAS